MACLDHNLDPMKQVFMKILKKYKETGVVDYVQKKPTTDELINKYGSGGTNIKEYEHKKVNLEKVRF